MQGKAAHHQANSDESKRQALLEECVLELEKAVKEAGILELFEESMMISMRLPNRPHPVACTFLRAPWAGGAITFDMQIGALSSRALAIAGRTTMAEADIVGTTLSFAPPPSFDEFEDGCCPICTAQRDMLEDVYRMKRWRGESSGRHPGKAPHEPDTEELETLAFAYHGILAAFHASELTPTDLSERSDGILEIRVDGTIDDLLTGRPIHTRWECIPFEPIQMAPFPAARLDRDLKRRPFRGKRSWILHMIPMDVSFAPSNNTLQMLFALDARTGDIVHQEVALEGTAAAIGRAMNGILREAGYRPGSAITTSPRLDDVLGEGLQKLGIRYVKRRRLKASDPRVQDLENYMVEAHANIMADMMADQGSSFPDPSC